MHEEVLLAVPVEVHQPRVFLAGHDDRHGLGVVMASVVVGGLDVVRQAAAPWPCHAVPDDLPVPLPLSYDTPETLGADRWLAACGAVELKRIGRAKRRIVRVLDPHLQSLPKRVEGHGSWDSI